MWVRGVGRAARLAQLEDIVRGPPDSLRRHEDNTLSGGWRCKSVESQVEGLVELATDPHVLARQWVGLATWL